MDKPAPDAKKLLNHWMEWERGETTPGELIKNLKIGGVREVLEAEAEAEAAVADAVADAGDNEGVESSA